MNNKELFELMRSTEHEWVPSNDKDFDNFEVSVEDIDYHNGPGCLRCGYSFCMHCVEVGWEEFKFECNPNPDNLVKEVWK